MNKLLLVLALVGFFQEDPEVELKPDRVPETKTGGSCLIQNATIITMGKAGTVQGDILVRNGKIEKIGTGLEASEEITRIDARGLHVLPGIIDCHAHIATQGGLNEGSQSVTPEVRVSDTLNPDDIAIYRALAGGTTTANILHGSANTIGGQNAVIKLRYGKRDLLFRNAPRGIKFALGENVKQSNFYKNWGKRFPNTRMGVEATLRRAFTEAQSYMKKWDQWEKRPEGTKPRRDLRLETLADILRGKILVHSHCYRADEILMLLRVAKDFGFRVATLQHVLEGYKVAPEIAAAGTGASTFADWWAFKIEAYDAIPHNAALMMRAGVLVSINSDSSDHIRRLNLEAAKGVKYGGLTREEALRLVTINPAKQLGIDQWVGSIEIGKDADLAFFQGHPLSTSSRCVSTMIEGELYFEDRGNPDLSVALAPPIETRPVRIPKGVSELALTNAEIHPVSSRKINRGTILIRNGKIVAVGREIEIPKEFRIVDLKGLRVYPGLIDSETSLGLREIGSVRGTVDEREIGSIQPDLKAGTAVHAESELIPVARANGITTALVIPKGGSISGQSSLIRLTGWTNPEMILDERVALHVRLPKSADRKKSGNPVEKWFEEAARYRASLEEGLPVKRDPRMDAMLPYLRGEKPVILHANTTGGIRAALKFADKHRLKPVISGGREAWKIAKFLAKKKVPVLLTVLNLPAKKHDPYDSAYFNAAKLHKAGVPFAICTSSHSNVRNLPYQAAMAAAYGLPRDAALKAITLFPAQILGWERELGSLEKGKRANLIVTTGDPLEIVTRVAAVMVDGKPVSTESRHTRLYRKYRVRGREGY